MSIVVRLYTRAGCHLCEAAETELRRLIARHAKQGAAAGPFELELVDVDRPANAHRPGADQPVAHQAGALRTGADQRGVREPAADQPGADLNARYGERVPVLAIGDREYAAPLPPALLERALRTALEEAGEPV